MTVENKILGSPAFTTTDICKRLGVNVSARFIEESLGIPPDEKTKTCCLWLETKFSYICYELTQHVFRVQQEYLDGLQEDSA